MTMKRNPAKPQFDLDHVMILIAQEIILCETRKAAAKKLGVTPSYISMVMKGRQEPGPKLLKALGLRRLVLYEPVTK